MHEFAQDQESCGKPQILGKALLGIGAPKGHRSQPFERAFDDFAIQSFI